MEKTIIIDEKKVRLKSTGATAIHFSAQFGKDYFAEILRLYALQKFEGKTLDSLTGDELATLNLDPVYTITWALAKTADNTIPDFLTWLDTFEEFQVLGIIPQVQDMLISTIRSKKK